MTDDPRTRELRTAWDALRTRVDRAATAAGRDRADVHVVAVTKTWPAADVAALHAIGVADIGENRVQELLAKIEALDAGGVLTESPPVRWHFIGQLQRNKAATVARACAVLHTLDRPELVGPLGRAAGAAGRVLDAFVQVSLDGDPRRGGAPTADVAALTDAVSAQDGLRLAGVMAVPPLDADPAESFGVLQEISARVQREHPDARWISAGMSGDLEVAVDHGATHLRVGTALLGSRP